METNQSTELARIVKESGLEPTKAQILLDKFTAYFDMAADWERKASAIVVTDASQLTEMKMAREGRLFLKQKRVDVEHTRKALKEQSLREGQTIDAIAKILTNLILPIEEQLEKQEKFAEIQEANRRAVRKEERLRELEQWGFIEGAHAVDLLNLDDQTYALFRDGIRKQHEDKIREEQERIENERKAAEERARIATENERLRKEAAEKEEQLRKEREEAERQRRGAEEKARKEREAIEAKAKAEREKAEREAQAKLDAERKERERVEAELKARRDADEKAERERIAAEKKAAAAPDKDKIRSAIGQVQLPSIVLKTTESQQIEKQIREKLEGWRAWANQLVDGI